ncbi:MAG: hypothetical protein J6A15_03110 [Clostridia bacterium]|nr:hypothetical protein [Clostridia bacterium]
MKNKKILFGIIGVIALIVIIVVSVLLYRFFKDMDAKNKLISEINSLNETNLNTEVTLEGEYGLIEQMVKQDYKTYYDSINKLRENYDKLSGLGVLNIQNFENDGPEFTTSLDTLNTLKTENETILATLNDLADDAKIDEKLANSNLSEENKKLYKEIINQLKLKDGVANIKESDTKFSTYLASLIDVLTYLKDNKNEWFIENGALKSKSQTFIDEYNKKIQDIGGMETVEGQN